MMFSDGTERQAEPAVNWTIRLLVAKIQMAEREQLERDNAAMRRILTWERPKAKAAGV